MLPPTVPISRTCAEPKRRRISARSGSIDTSAGAAPASVAVAPICKASAVASMMSRPVRPRWMILSSVASQFAVPRQVFHGDQLAAIGLAERSDAGIDRLIAEATPASRAITTVQAPQSPSAQPSLVAVARS